VSPITERDFQSALPLSPRVKSALFAAVENGWSEPQKIHQSSAKLRQALGEAREVIAGHLGLLPNELEFVGELGFGYWSAISGLLLEGKRSFIHSPIDRQIVHAFGRQISEAGGQSQITDIEPSGRVDYQRALNQAPESLLVWQGTNREMGIEQEFPDLPAATLTFADLTARFNPKLNEDVDVLLWDPRNFGGPEGLAILGLPSGSRWRSPIPPIDNRRLFGSYSKPLLIATAVALDEWMQELENRRKYLTELNIFAREALTKSLEVKLVGESNNSDPRYLALVFDGVIAEELLREVEKSGFLIDAGSACGAGALQPSHVLSALGYGADGHFRITLKANQNRTDIKGLIDALQGALAKLDY
jgi:cysteine desulfurase